VPVVAFGLVQVFIAVFCLRLLVENPFVGLNAQYLSLMRASAIATLIIGSLLAISARSLERLVAYLLLIDIGAGLLALTFGGLTGQATLLSLVLVRVISLTLAAVGLGLINLRANDAGDPRALTIGSAWHTPIGLLLFIYGGLSLLGIPLTPGFSSRWAVILLTGQQAPLAAVVLVLAMTAGTFSLFWHLLGAFSQRGNVEGSVIESVGLRIAVFITIGVGILVSLFPQLIMNYASNMAKMF
jgi:NADH:ubiquinone oxidoreductase subunit 2 (subunit N)